MTRLDTPHAPATPGADFGANDTGRFVRFAYTRSLGDLHQVGQVHVHGAEQSIASRAGTGGCRGDRFTQPVQCRTIHGIAVEVLFDERRLSLGVPLQLPVLAKDGA